MITPYEITNQYHKYCDQLNFRTSFNKENVDENVVLLFRMFVERWNMLDEKQRELTRDDLFVDSDNILNKFEQLVSDENITKIMLCIFLRLKQMYRRITGHTYHHGLNCPDYGHIIPINEAVYLLQYFLHIRTILPELKISVQKLSRLDFKDANIPNIFQIENYKIPINTHIKESRLIQTPGWTEYKKIDTKNKNHKDCIMSELRPDLFKQRIRYNVCNDCKKIDCICKCPYCDKEVCECKEICPYCDKEVCECKNFNCSQCKHVISGFYISGRDKGEVRFHPQCILRFCEGCDRHLENDPLISNSVSVNGLICHKNEECIRLARQKPVMECKACFQPSSKEQHIICSIIQRVGTTDYDTIIKTPEFLHFLNFKFGIKKSKKSVKKSVKTSKKSVKTSKKSIKNKKSVKNKKSIKTSKKSIKKSKKSKKSIKNKRRI